MNNPSFHRKQRTTSKTLIVRTVLAFVFIGFVLAWNYRALGGLPPPNAEISVPSEFQMPPPRKPDLQSVDPSLEWKISVIVPMYFDLSSSNSMNYIQQTVQSILDQTYEHWELVVVDDCSPRPTLLVEKIVQRLVNSDSKNRIRGFSKHTNTGLADTRNFGIKQSTGNWIFPLDSDDMIHSSFFEKAIRELKQNSSINLIISDLGYINDNGVLDPYATWEIPPWDPEMLAKKNLFHCSALFKKKLWEKTEGYNPSLLFGWEDWDFW